MTKRKITTSDIESALARYFDPRKNIVVPNISWGAGLHECDILVIRKNGHLVEVEIKISKSDLKADLKKPHAHKSDRIKELYYCVTEELYDLAINILPESVGIFVCTQTEGGHIYVTLKRSCVPNHKFRVATEEEKLNIARLGCLRIWNLKRAVNDLNKTDQAAQLKEVSKNLKNLIKSNHEGTREYRDILWKIKESMPESDMSKEIMQVLIKNS